MEKISDYVYIVRERLDLIEPRFRTKWVNLYFIVGEFAIAVVDTGSGLINLNQFLQKHFPEKEVLVFNTHNHFDHVGGNKYFKKVHIHKLDLYKIVNGVDLSFLDGSESELVKNYELLYLDPPEEYLPLVGGEQFDLGGIKIKVVHTPGHTYGSICIVTSKGEIFTGDAYHTGAYYLPEVSRWDDVIDSLQIITNLQGERIYPGHEDISVSKKNINELISILSHVDQDDAIYDEFLECNIIEYDSYSLIYPKS